MKFESVTELEVLRYAYEYLLEKWFFYKEKSKNSLYSEYAKKMVSLLDKQLNELGCRIYSLEKKGLR